MGETDRLQVAFKRLLKEPDEKVVRKIIREDLGRPEGSPEHEYLMDLWSQCREREGWKVAQK